MLAASAVGMLAMAVATAALVVGVGPEPVRVRPGPIGVEAQAREWVLANLDPTTTLLAPASLSAALAARGHQAGQLVEYPDGVSAGAAAVDHRCCAYVAVLGPSDGDIVADVPEGVRSAYERSRGVAAFAAGDRRAEVRHIVGQTAEEVAEAVAAERDTAAAAGRELASGGRMTFSPAARAQLLAGEVDARVILALVGISGRHRFSVAEFPAGPAEVAAGAPRRSAAIDAIEGTTPDDGSESTADVREFLEAQVEPYRPPEIAVVTSGDVPLLTFGFPEPGPLGLLEAAAPVS